MSRTTAPPPEIVLTRLTKAGGPLTKQISLAADGTLIQGRLGLRDGPRHGRARHGCRRRWARRADRRR